MKINGRREKKMCESRNTSHAMSSANLSCKIELTKMKTATLHDKMQDSPRFGAFGRGAQKHILGNVEVGWES